MGLNQGIKDCIATFETWNREGHTGLVRRKCWNAVKPGVPTTRSLRGICGAYAGSPSATKENERVSYHCKCVNAIIECIMDTPDNFYAILGVPIDAESETLKRAYRQLARRYHPDVAGLPGQYR